MMADATIKRPALRYHGGKWRLAPWVISHFPAHRTYVEPFGGGASVLLRKPRSYAEVYNDQWQRVVDVFRVLRDPVMAADLRRRLELTPFSRVEFESVDEVALSSEQDIIERVRLTIFRSFAGFGSASTNGQHSTGFRANSNRSHTTPAHDWANYPAQLPAFVSRMRGVIIECRPASAVIDQHDGLDTLHYIDPPYVHETRNLDRGNAMYAFELADADHAALAGQLRQLAGMVIVSGYRCDLYDDLFKGWKRSETAALSDGAKKRTECLWLNDAAVERHRSFGMFVTEMASP